jgi:hypothetical protein
LATVHDQVARGTPQSATPQLSVTAGVRRARDSDRARACALTSRGRGLARAATPGAAMRSRVITVQASADRMTAPVQSGDAASGASSPVRRQTCWRLLVLSTASKPAFAAVPSSFVFCVVQTHPTTVRDAPRTGRASARNSLGTSNASHTTCQLQLVRMVGDCQQSAAMPQPGLEAMWEQHSRRHPSKGAVDGTTPPTSAGAVRRWLVRMTQSAKKRARPPCRWRLTAISQDVTPDEGVPDAAEMSVCSFVRWVR